MPALTANPNPLNSRWWTVGAYAALVLLLSVIPSPEGPPGIPHLDKVAHVCEYAVFAWLLARAFRSDPVRCPRRFWLSAIGLAAAYGWLMEAVQMVLPWRSAEWADAVMDVLGAWAGGWIARRRMR